MFRWTSSFLLAALLPCTLPAAAQGVRDYTQPESLVLQKESVATAALPKGIDGRPDWVRALQQGLIAPRATLRGTPRPDETMGEAPRDGIVFSNTQFMPYVVFPHKPHAEWLACANCHDGLFERRATGKGQGMTAIFQGRHCGFCHGRVAFSPEGSCYRCHSKPNPAAVQTNSPFTAPAKVERAPVPDDPEEEGGRRRRGKTGPGRPGGFQASPVIPPMP
jgi:c(7)-type cytochrome triheme protein